MRTTRPSMIWSLLSRCNAHDNVARHSLLLIIVAGQGCGSLSTEQEKEHANGTDDACTTTCEFPRPGLERAPGKSLPYRSRGWNSVQQCYSDQQQKSLPLFLCERYRELHNRLDPTLCPFQTSSTAITAMTNPAWSLEKLSPHGSLLYASFIGHRMTCARVLSRGRSFMMIAKDLAHHLTVDSSRY